MRFSVAYLLALASAALAQTAGFDVISKPADAETVPAGQAYTITWAASTQYSGTVSVILLGGATQSTLQILGTLGTADNAAGTFAWSVASDLGDLATYGIKIALDSDPTIFQYSFPFKISAAAAAATTSSAVATSAAATTAAATTADSYVVPAETPSGYEIPAETTSAASSATDYVVYSNSTSTVYAACNTSTYAPPATTLVTSQVPYANVSTSVYVAVETPATPATTATPVYSVTSVAQSASTKVSSTAVASTAVGTGSKTGSYLVPSSSSVVVVSGASNVAGSLVALIGGLAVSLYFM